jgi:hypothetical protein
MHRTWLAAPVAYSTESGLTDMESREALAGEELQLDVYNALSRGLADDVRDKYHARTVAEQFTAGRPPVSSRQIVKAIKCQ